MSYVSGELAMVRVAASKARGELVWIEGVVRLAQGYETIYVQLSDENKDTM